MLNLKFKRWFKNQKKINKISTKQIILTKINKWSCTDKEISHNSKKFFKIIGLKVYTNFYKKNWDQPIIVQNELGILGIIKNTKNGKYVG